MSLEQSDAWLHTLEPAPRVDGASMLDGYLTAIVIGPCSIPLDKWFVHLLGERGRIASASGGTMVALTTIATRLNAISQGPVPRAQQARAVVREDRQRAGTAASVVHGIS